MVMIHHAISRPIGHEPLSPHCPSIIFLFSAVTLGKAISRRIQQGGQSYQLVDFKSSMCVVSEFNKRRRMIVL